MKSSSGEHYIALDHMRAVAVFLVFSFHFLHGGFQGFPVPFDYRPAIFPFSILNQSHTGVALFMTLSGYLFAKLLDGKQVNYAAFFWNRALRLLPLLVLVVIVCGIQTYVTQGRNMFMLYVALVERGYYKPTLPNGAWSVMIEIHFYILLPLILWFGRKSRWTLPAIVLAAIGLRTWLHHEHGEVQQLAYLTLVGRIDQFLLGILAFNYRKAIANRHVWFWIVVTAFLLFYWQFNMAAAKVKDPSLLAASAAWIYIPTLEGLAYGFIISYYDNTFRPSNTGISRWIGDIGAYSYSIYLLHFFVVYQLVALVNGYIMPLTNFYLICLWSLLCFAVMLPIGYLSFRFIESPFLKFRRPYLIRGNPPAPAAPLSPSET